MTPSTSSLVASQRLRVAYLLTLAGGYLDAYTYFERGGVFANAQTGNIVKLGIALANGARDQYLTFLIPILSFAAGILTALFINAALNKRGIRLVRRSVLVVEIIGLGIVACIPTDPRWNMLANCIVSFVAAMQFEAFGTFRGEVIATTMSTGNLRKFIDNLYAGVTQSDISKINSASTYLTIIITFTFGAFLGTRVCNVLDRAGVIPAIVCLGIVVIVITLLRRKNIANER